MVRIAHKGSNSAMMVLFHSLPRYSPISIPNSNPSAAASVYNHFHFVPKSKPSTNTRWFRSTTPNLSTTLPLKPISISTTEQQNQTHIQISVEKLFVSPEVDVSSTNLLNSRVLKGSNIVLSHYATDAQISQSEFVKSSTGKEECPADGRPEFALVGRFNVGKSSLLNSLIRRKRLALTSKKLR